MAFDRSSSAIRAHSDRTRDNEHAASCHRHEPRPPRRDLGPIRALVALSELAEAEHRLAELLHRSPTDEDALRLFGALKHRRGELTLALGCWRALAARRRTERGDFKRELAWLHARANGALPASEAGRDPCQDEPLVTALRQHLRGHTEEAVRECRLVAERHRKTNPELHRLALHVEAWCFETSANLPSACEALERLGKHRSFAHDHGRLTALAALYEKTADPERLEAAAHLYRFIERHDPHAPPVDGHLARVYRALGREDSMRIYEERHLRRIEDLAQRATARDLLDFAATRYVPLSALARGLASERKSESLDDATSFQDRSAALRLAVLNRPAEAERELAKSDAPLDAMYRADIARQRGDDLAASRLLVAALGNHATSRAYWAAGALIELLDGAGAETIRAARSGDGKLDAVVTEAVAERLALDPNDTRANEWLTRWRGDASNEAPVELRTRALLRSEFDTTAPPVGRVLSAAVHRTGVERRGLFHELWVYREPVEKHVGGHLPIENVLGNVSDEFARDVRNVFYSVREWARFRLPHRVSELAHFRYGLKVTKDDETSSGRSAGLAAALGFLSSFVEWPVRPNLAASGALVADSHRHVHVARVGDVEPKTLAAFEARLGRLLLPLGNRAELEGSSEVPRVVTQAHVCFVSTFEEAARVAFGDELFE